MGRKITWEWIKYLLGMLGSKVYNLERMEFELTSVGLECPLLVLPEFYKGRR